MGGQAVVVANRRQEEVGAYSLGCVEECTLGFREEVVRILDFQGEVGSNFVGAALVVMLVGLVLVQELD